MVSSTCMPLPGNLSISGFNNVPLIALLIRGFIIATSKQGHVYIDIGPFMIKMTLRPKADDDP